MLYLARLLALFIAKAEAVGMACCQKIEILPKFSLVVMLSLKVFKSLLPVSGFERSAERLK